MGEWTWNYALGLVLEQRAAEPDRAAAARKPEAVSLNAMRKETLMSKERNEEQPKGRFRKVRTALVWLAVFVAAAFPFPWWP